MTTSGLVRPRLVESIRALAPGSMCALVAPAGAGKTTLLEHACADTPGSAWLGIDRRCTDQNAFLAVLRRALAPLVVPREWTNVEQAAADLDDALEEPSVLVIDDVHEASATAIDIGLRALLEHQPRLLTIMLASRRPLPAPLARRRLGSGALEVGPAELRFRLWEIDELFSTCFGVRPSWEETRLLADRTGGWAAGLRMAHLGTRHLSAAGRLDALRSLSGGPRLIREYLSAMVLDAVTADERDFLLRTSVFDTVDAVRCNALLSTADAAHTLDDLARRGMFLERVSEHGYQYHEALRAHLRQTFADEEGSDETRMLYRRAAKILLAEGAPDEAVRSYLCAGDWRSAARLIGRAGEVLAATPGSWLAALPASVIEGDAWCGLAVARGLMADGALRAAASAYHEVIGRFPDSRAALRAGDEADLLDAWNRPGGRSGTHWLHRLRLSVSDPHRLVQLIDVPSNAVEELTLALGLLLIGERERARALFAAVATRPDVGTVLELCAVIGCAVCGWLAGGVGAVDRCRQLADELGWPVAVRIADAVAGLADTAAYPHLRRGCAAAGDEWGEAVVAILAVVAGAADADTATAVLARLEAPALAQWVSSLAWQPATFPVAVDGVQVRCLGPLEIRVNDVCLDTSRLTPRNLELLRFLCVHAGEVVPTERILDALWPSTDPARARHSLHTAVSTVRRALEPDGPPWTVLLTDNDTYRLVADQMDVRDDIAVARQLARHDIGIGDEQHCRAVLNALTREVLPEAGACDWLMDVRDEARSAVSTLAVRLAAALGARDEHASAAQVASAALERCPYDDALWRALINAHTESGNRLAAHAARSKYRRLIGELAAG